MTYKEIHDLHVQLLSIYKKNQKSYDPYQKEIDYFNRQFYIAKDIVQRIFVMNQLVILYEKSRAEQVKYCLEKYFNRNISGIENSDDKHTSDG